MKLGDTVVLKDGRKGKLMEVRMTSSWSRVDLSFFVNCGGGCWNHLDLYEIDWHATEAENARH